MNPRSTMCVLVAALLAVPQAFAANYQIAGGAVRFTAPDAWTVIMSKQDGDPQFMAFQVPSPGANALPRITVTAQRAADASAYQQFLQDNEVKAHRLTAYHAETTGSGSDDKRYIAQENKQRTAYAEYYAYRDGLAVQVRCVRPDDGSPQWNATFDASCSAIAKSVAR